MTASGSARALVVPVVPGEAASMYERVLGSVRGDRPGPTLICVGGIHGNEPAGVLALERVLEQLERRGAQLRGEFVALAGNRVALAAGSRFVDRDLNRAWTDERLARLQRDGVAGGDAEDREQVELLETIDEIVTQARGPVYLIDFHTTSGFGGMFSTFADSLRNRDFARPVPLPMVLGLEELVQGTLLGFLGEHGLVAIAVETGQHEEKRAVDRAESVIWIGLRTAGLLRPADVPEAKIGQAMLRSEARGLPRAVEMRFKYDVTPDDDFVMKPGFENFQTVREGQLIAEDQDGDVLVAEDSILLMPLYQEQGEDGFFLVREFSAFWLRVSRGLRSVQADRFVSWLPGVRRDHTDPDVMHVDRGVARWYALQLFHLLGFRSVRESGDHLVVRRRRFDEARFLSRGVAPEDRR